MCLVHVHSYDNYMPHPLLTYGPFIVCSPAIGKLKLKAVRFPNNAHLEPVMLHVALVTSSDSRGCNFGIVVNQILSETFVFTYN